MDPGAVCGSDRVQWDHETCPDGDPSFLSLLRETRAALLRGKILSAAVSFWSVLTREEVLEALEARRTQIVAWLSSNRYAEDSIRRSPATPQHVVEHFMLAGARMEGELHWTESVARRVKDGDYAFRGEEHLAKYFPEPPRP